MNSFSHFWISYIKSMVRIVSCVVALCTYNLDPIGVGFLIAEILGILEEVVDRR